MIAIKDADPGTETATVTAFVCVNCARPARGTTSAERSRPAIPDLQLPGRARQVPVPCAGRLQPEHVLRAFESGATVVSVVACDEDNCHHVEGSRRCALRVDFIRSILREIGLGEERLLLFHLPGSAVQDLALASGGTAAAGLPESPEPRMAAIRREVSEAIRLSAPNPLRESPPAGPAGGSPGNPPHCDAAGGEDDDE